MAYVREQVIKRGGKTYRYYQLVRGYREDGKVKIEVLDHLGKFNSKAEAQASVVTNAEEARGNYWVTNPPRLGYDGGFEKPMYPVFLSKEAAEAYGGPGSLPGEPKPEFEILQFDGPGLAAFLHGAYLGASHIAIWETPGARSKPNEVLTRRAFMKRLERSSA